MTEDKKTGKQLELRVAAAYRRMGARKVEHDAEMGGRQIDVYVELEGPDRSVHRIAVEVKDYDSPVGSPIVEAFSNLVARLHRERLIDEGVIVAASGFSRPARNAAKVDEIRLLTPEDLDVLVEQARAPRPGAGSCAPVPPDSARAALPPGLPPCDAADIAAHSARRT
jgi:hypothetical protein